MLKYEIEEIRHHPELLEQASRWFHEKWNVPLSAYIESMQACIQKTSAVPQWYVVRHNAQIIAGLGIIENDFHDRPDLTPNVCAVYVEEAYRKQGLAGALLRYVCDAFSAQGIDTLYLITDHVGFYERYGWRFLCMVQGDGEAHKTRMYIHQNGNS